MSPRAGDKRRITGRVVGAAGIGAGLLAISIGLLSSIGTGSDIPVSVSTVRLSLVATRDLDVSGALPAGGTTDNKPLVSDQTWTRTGGESCYPISSTDASCFANTEIPYTVDATGLGWVVEPDSVNRLLYSTAIDSTNWTVGGTATATPLQTAPDGSATASIISVSAWGSGNQVVGPGRVGYTAGTAISVRMWVKCSAGILRLFSVASSGDWRVDCSVVAGEWTLINSAHPALTEATPWITTATGGLGFYLLSMAGTVTASIWAPTLTEEPGSGLAVIPTGAAAVSTGDPSWTIANGGTYWRSGDTVTQLISEITGTCFVSDATTITLSGAAGSECSGVWYGLEIAP